MPEVSARERGALMASVLAGVLWCFVLLAVYFMPAAWDAVIQALDVVLWPVIRAAGRFWGVVLISAGTAVLTMACQWACTDVKRLRELKQHLGSLREEWLKTKEGSEEDKAIGRIMHRGEWRIARAAFVPLGLLLGPVMLSFMWFPERVDLSRVNPMPGDTVRISASVDGEYSGKLRVGVKGASVTESVAPSEMEVVSVRRTLEELRHDLREAEGGRTYSPAVKEHLGSSGKTPREAREALEEFLAKPVPPQVIQWSLATATEGAQRLEFELAAEDKGEGSLWLATGDALPPRMVPRPEAKELVLAVKGQGVVKEIRATYEMLPEQRKFWQPLGWAGVSWDAGWLWLYMVSYVPAMYVAKRVFRIP